jgi:acyl carrier protein
VNTFEVIQKIISTNLDVPAANVRPDSKASDFAAWDSVHHLVLIMEIERELELKFTMDEIAEMGSVDKIVNAVDKKVAN